MRKVKCQVILIIYPFRKMDSIILENEGFAENVKRKTDEYLNIMWKVIVKADANIERNVETIVEANVYPS